MAFTLLAAVALPGCSTLQTDCGAECEDDTRIAGDVLSVLRDDHPEIQLQDVSVECRRHVVYLYGLVDTDLERSIVEGAAANVSGVTSVVNSISVRGNSR
jgi:osmotically-inducible protein OsmY